MESFVDFLKANSQSLFTLAGVLIGSWITLRINSQNLRSQSLERDKDRQEAWREAKTQLAVALMKNDIKIVEEAVDNSLRDMSVVGDMSVLYWDKKLSIQELKEKIKSAMFDEQGKLSELRYADITSEKIACTLGEEIYSEFKRFDELEMAYWNLVINDASAWDDKGKKERESNAKVISSAGKLHGMLREKLISLRQ